jgi:hypothetical protein
MRGPNEDFVPLDLSSTHFLASGPFIAYFVTKMDSNLPPSPPPVPSAPPPVPESARQPSSLRRLVLVLLNLCLALFIVDALLSLADDSLILLAKFHLLSGLRGFVGGLYILLALAIYALMGLTPMVPKRFFLPVSLFGPVAGLLLLPALIYFSNHAALASWVVSLLQVILSLALFRFLRRHGASPAPAEAAQEPSRRSGNLFNLMSADRLNPRGFSLFNLAGFIAANLFILLPAVLAYLFACGSLALNHLSEGFIRLRPNGFTVEVRKYIRDDGKTIQLVPMAHVGEPEFYRNLTQSFPTNSVILMEGVTDDNNLLTNKVSYHRMAKSLGLSEQQKEFKPQKGEWVPADIDVKEFAPTTIDFLNMAMLVHRYGLNVQTLLPLLQYSPPANVQEQMWDDLLHKRNRHLLSEIRKRLSDSDYIIIPWGAAHMPEISHELQNSGFRLVEKQTFQAIHFGGRRGGN